MKTVEERHGFVIREREEEDTTLTFISRPYVVFHPNFNGTWIVDFESYTDAKNFCEEEDADSWAETIRQG